MAEHNGRGPHEAHQPTDHQAVPGRFPRVDASSGGASETSRTLRAPSVPLTPEQEARLAKREQYERRAVIIGTIVTTGSVLINAGLNASEGHHFSLTPSTPPHVAEGPVTPGKGIVPKDAEPLAARNHMTDGEYLNPDVPDNSNVRVEVSDLPSIGNQHHRASVSVDTTDGREGGKDLDLPKGFVARVDAADPHHPGEKPCEVFVARGDKPADRHTPEFQVYQENCD